METKSKIIDAEFIEVEITTTMTLGEWLIIAKTVNGTSDVSKQFRDQIIDVINKMEKIHYSSLTPTE